MAYTVHLYSFSKKINSTARPSGDGTTFSCVLKNGTSLEKPVFVIQGYHLNAYASYNYMKFLGKYFYIADIVSVHNNICEVVAGELDVLATYKSEISAYEAYVTRTNKNNKYDKMLYDNIIAPSTEIKSKGSLVSTGLDFSLGEPTVVIGTSGCGPIRASASVDNYYYSTTRGADVILGDIFQNNDIFGIVQQMLKMTDCLTMVKIFPFSKASTEGKSSDVYVGEFSVTVNGLETMHVDDFSSASVHGRYFGTGFTIALAGDDLFKYDDYRNYDSNFVNLILRLPFVGSIALQPWILKFDTLVGTYKIDMISGIGECELKVMGNSGVQTIGIYSCQVGFSVPSSSYTTDYAEVVGNVVQGNAAGAILDNIIPPSSYSSLSVASGSATINIIQATLDYVIYDSESFAYGENRGHKSMQREQISQLTGAYIECLHPSVSIPGRNGDADKVNMYLADGFYYE